MGKRTRCAFTLIELLVVIAIIAILAAILFPVFAKAREKARQSSCLSNEKQIGTATLMYCQDYDETYPFWGWTSAVAWPYGKLLAAYPDLVTVGSSPNTYDGSPWTYLLAPYIKNNQLWYCPSAPKDPADMYKDPTTGRAPTNYHGNAFIFLPLAFTSKTGLTGPATLAAVTNPTETFIWEDWGQGYTDGAVHVSGTNFACCDGHAKWQKQGQKTIKGWAN